MPVAAAPSANVVEVDGSPLADDVLGCLESTLVVDRLSAPDMFVLVFRDPTRDTLSKAGLEIGKKVVISTSGPGNPSPAVLITGEVTAIETEYDTLGARAIVRGYDKSHRLASGRKTATYQDVSYSDIVSQVGSAAGFSVDADSTDGSLEHVLQANQSDLDFLYAIARRVGYDLRVDGDTILFKEPVASGDAPEEGDPESTDPVQLVWGANLLEFRARMSAVAQVSQVEVRGWDTAEKKEIIGTAEPTATHADLGTTPADLAALVGGQTMVVVDHAVGDQETADRLARARAEQVGSAAFEATAVTIGDPALKAGVAVSIAGVDPALCGKWVVSGSRHEFNGGSYRTALEFTGRQDRTILGLVTQGGSGGDAGDRIPGVVTAIVDDNDDPEQAGRVRLQYPWMGSAAVSFWARLAAPGAGKDSGVVWLPQVGDEVLVAFEHGDTSRPIVLAGLWNGTDTFPMDKIDGLDSGKVKGCGFISRSGHRIVFFEDNAGTKIEIATPDDKVKFVLDGEGGTLTIETEGDISIKSGGAMTLEASGDMTIKGSTVALN